MKQTTKAYMKSIINMILAVITVILLITFVPKLLSFFMPFVVGWVISLIASPIVKVLEERLKIKRKTGTAVVIIVVLTAVIVLGYFLLTFLAKQIGGLMADLPAIWKNLQAELELLGANITELTGKMPGDLQSGLENIIINIEKYFNTLFTSDYLPSFDWISNMAQKVPDMFVGIIMGLMSAFLFTANRAGMHNFIQDYMPQGMMKYWVMIKESMSSAVGGYFKAQLKIEIWIYFILLIGLLILQISYVPLVALLIAIVDLLPVFGAGTIMIPWALFALFTGEYIVAIGLLVIWAITQIVRQLIQPKIVGDTMGISPLTTLFLLFVGYKVAGVLGMILAMPIGIILLNMYQAGVFDTVVGSVRILCNGLNEFRTLTQEDLKLGIPKSEEKLKEKMEEKMEEK